MMTGRVQVARAVVSLYHLSYWPALWASEESNLDLAFYRSMYARAVLFTKQPFDLPATPAEMATWTGFEPVIPCSTDRYVDRYTTRPYWSGWRDSNPSASAFGKQRSVR